ncbi:MAG: sugar transferase [Chloroflexota bacterium]|jgi:exopolysaccharide biosynthesis polyprenyl glycosylphosphotransferase
MSTVKGVQKEATEQRARKIRWPMSGLRASERRLLLRSGDITLLCISLGVAVAARTALLPNLGAALANIKWFVTLALVWLLFAAVFDVYDLGRAASISRSASSTGAAAAVASVSYLFIPWLTPPLENRSFGFLFVAAAVVSVLSWRLVYASLFAQAIFKRRLLVVGAGHSGQDLVSILRGAAGDGDVQLEATGYDIVGFVDDNAGLQGARVAAIPVLGSSGDLLRLVRGEDIDEVVVAITHTETIGPQLYEAILDCKEMGVPVVSMMTLYQRLTGRVPIEHASQNIEHATGQSDSAYLRMYGLAKRVVDLVGALVAAVPFCLLIPLVALTNVFASRGPLFFRQTRVGKGGHLFEVIKFRSMRPDAEDDSGAVWASQDDDRVTNVGRFLRRTHLDELPQVINVLRGEMSLVGPRPERPEFVATLSKSIPFYRARHAVRPGITGWAQIHQDYGDSYERAREKLEYDLYYLKRQSPILDTEIILRTITKVLRLKGR